MKEFEKLGKEILRHKLLYYKLGKAELDDYAYDMLEEKYINMAKNIEKEPEVHIIADWAELKIMGGFHASCIVGYDDSHPWMSDIVKEIECKS